MIFFFLGGGWDHLCHPHFPLPSSTTKQLRATSNQYQYSQKSKAQSVHRLLRSQGASGQLDRQTSYGSTMYNSLLPLDYMNDLAKGL